MQTPTFRRSRFARSLSVIALAVLPAFGAASLGEGGDPRVAPPNGLSADDWSGIRAAYDAARHAARPTEQGYLAHNPGQGWQTEFDGRGFSTRPDASGWTWGLELESYGYPGTECTIEGPACADADGGRVTYGWGEDLEEWYVNDTRGLEHGYTVHRRPEGGGASGPLQLTLAVRGSLRPSLQAGALGVSFLDEAGTIAVTYSGLMAFDATGTRLPARFEVVDARIRLSVDDASARYPLTIDPTAQQAYLKASNTDNGDRFGHKVAVSGDTVVVAAPFEDSNATGVNGNQFNESMLEPGAAYVFVRNGAGWTQQAYLKPSNSNFGFFFGYALSVSGDTVVVGAYGENGSATGVNGDQSAQGAFASGAAYVFVRSGTTWSQQAYLKASNTDALDLFGRSVSVSGDTIVVAARAEASGATGVNGDQSDNSSTDAGAAYVFVRSGTTWSQQAYLKASNTGANDSFGLEVSVSGDTIVVGANGEDSAATGVDGDQLNESAPNSGAAYVFVRSGTTWSQQAYLKPSNTDADDRFGISLSVSGDTVVVGAPSESSSATGVDGDQSNNAAALAGAAYVFTRSGSVWSQQAYLKASNTDAGDEFGISVSVSGDALVVGAYREDGGAYGVNGDQGTGLLLGSDSGAAYVFVRSGTTWSQQSYLKSSFPDNADHFGWSVSASGSTVVVGAPRESSKATGVNGNQVGGFFGPMNLAESGAAYVFNLDVPFVQYCHQNQATSVPGCFAQLSAEDPTLATGTWDTTLIPRSSTVAAGNTVGIYIYTHGVGLGQSAFSAVVPYGILCLQGFKRSAPACAPVFLATQPGVCNSGVMSLALDCSSGALGLVVGEDVNVQMWFRDPTSGGGPQAAFSNAIFYTIQ